MFVFGLLAQIIVYGSLGFLSPTLSLHLLSYEGYDEFWIGVYFSVPAVIYIVNTPMVSLYCKFISRRGVVWLGMCCFCLSVFLIGTSPLLGVPDLGKVIFMGLCITGFAAAMIVIPIFPEMLFAIE
jgi:predicted MFS family arabinose efflux permease